MTRHLSPQAWGLAVLALACVPSGAQAAAFALQNQNGSGTGLAFAGAAAIAEDASTVYFNPAGMLLLPEGQHFSTSGTAILRRFDFRNTGTTPATTLDRAGLLEPLVGPVVPSTTGETQPIGPDGKVDATSLVPNAYYVRSINSRLRLGMGVGVTFGSATEYDEDYFGRYAGIYTEYRQINLNPSLAYRLNEIFSIGGGLNIASAEANFEQGIPLRGEALGKIDVTGTGFGFNIGLLAQPRKDLRLGLTYRSEIDIDFEGDQTVPRLDVNREVEAMATTPAMMSLSAVFTATPRLDLLADLTRTNWSSLAVLAPFVKGSTEPAAAPIRFNFKDVNRYSIGARYQYSPRLSLRTGLAYDETPVPDAESRTTTLPDTDRLWLSAGARYGLSDKSSVDVGLTHIVAQRGEVNKAVLSPDEQTLLQTVRGVSEGSANLLSIQYNRSF